MSIGMKKMILLLLVISLTLLLLGCASGPQKYMLAKEDSQKQKAMQEVQLANPASVYCLNNSGTWSVKGLEDGQQGICTFADGSWCDEWDYLNGKCRPGMNLTDCAGQFWGKTVCPTLYEPVCAKIELGNSAPYQIRWETFSNNCLACIASTKMEVVTGYIKGKCAEE